MRLDVADCVTYSLDVLCVCIGNCEVKCLLEFHDKLYCVERVCTEVLVELSLGSYLIFVYCEFVYDDLFYFLFNVRYDLIILNC